MNSRLTKLVRRRPWALFLAAVATLVEILLAILWFQDRSRDWAEPALVLFGLLMVLLGMPSLKDLLADDSEQKLAEQVVTFLENKGLLFVSYCYEHPSDCHASAKDIRDGLTVLMREMHRNSVIFGCADSIRLRCASFMRELERQGVHKKQYTSDLTPAQENNFEQAIASLRVDCGRGIVQISKVYDVVVRGDLATMLPLEYHSDDFGGRGSPNPSPAPDG